MHFHLGLRNLFLQVVVVVVDPLQIGAVTERADMRIDVVMDHVCVGRRRRAEFVTMFTVR